MEGSAPTSPSAPAPTLVSTSASIQSPSPHLTSTPAPTALPALATETQDPSDRTYTASSNDQTESANTCRNPQQAKTAAPPDPDVTMDVLSRALKDPKLSSAASLLLRAMNACPQTALTPPSVSMAAAHMTANAAPILLPDAASTFSADNTLMGLKSMSLTSSTAPILKKNPDSGNVERDVFKKKRPCLPPSLNGVCVSSPNIDVVLASEEGREMKRVTDASGDREKKSSDIFCSGKHRHHGQRQGSFKFRKVGKGKKSQQDTSDDDIGGQDVGMDTPQVPIALASQPRLMSPQAHLDFILQNRNYSIPTSTSAQKGYKTKPTPLQLASFGKAVLSATESSDTKMLSLLLKSGLSPNPCNAFGDSLINVACRRGDTSIVRCMLEECGSSVKVSDSFGRTPLHHAAWSGKPCFDIVKMLLDRELDLLVVTDDNGLSPFKYISGDQWDGWVKFLDEVKDRYWPAKNLLYSSKSKGFLDRAISNKAGQDGEKTGMTKNVSPIQPDPLPEEIAAKVASGEINVDDIEHAVTEYQHKKCDNKSSSSSSTSSALLPRSHELQQMTFTNPQA